MTPQERGRFTVILLLRQRQRCLAFAVRREHVGAVPDQEPRHDLVVARECRVQWRVASGVA